MRRIGNRFHIKDDQIIKTSNNDPIPIEEPVFLVRARDRLALGLLKHYKQMGIDDGCNQEFLVDIDKAIEEFRQFRIQYYDRMKQPNITKGK